MTHENASRGCLSCRGTGWTEDENWEPDYPDLRQVRAPGRGLIRCRCDGWGDVQRDIDGAADALKLIDALLEEEGNSVTIFADNADFNGQPSCAIEYTSANTGWVPRRFTGDTLQLCLRNALDHAREPIHEPTAPRESISAQAVREAWRAAITLGNNICVQESDRENDKDGDIGWINGTAECAKRIRDYAEPVDAQLVEMLTEAGARNALAAFSAPSSRGAAQEPAAYCDSSDSINSTAFAWPGTERKDRHSTPLYTGPAPQQREGAPAATNALRCPFCGSADVSDGDVLAFLPGRREIEQARAAIDGGDALDAPVAAYIRAAVAAHIDVSGEEGSVWEFLAALEHFLSRLAGENAS